MAANKGKNENKEGDQKLTNGTNPDQQARANETSSSSSLSTATTHWRSEPNSTDSSLSTANLVSTVGTEACSSTSSLSTGNRDEKNSPSSGGKMAKTKWDGKTVPFWRSGKESHLDRTKRFKLKSKQPDALAKLMQQTSEETKGASYQGTKAEGSSASSVSSTNMLPQQETPSAKKKIVEIKSSCELPTHKLSDAAVQPGASSSAARFRAPSHSIDYSQASNRDQQAKDEKKEDNENASSK
ncbi:unnamed protein product [Caenorhabditis bovis]|uniref:Uncharacterized protein n=1 Tax=Caenorhabditis bovis TaxID=2654633 RepID=A0A8S1FFZ0_9PELO|nr:unnamed protein product [Caenorhabditis bovis]